ncbi:MAG: hypothetical protein IT405_01025 [Candidatus Yanofskybacteria bacterium]|nr:hypothetical protein [Candidatus Yanofskybacteria bacterium]
MRLLTTVLLCLFPAAAVAQEAMPPAEPTDLVDILPIRSLRIDTSTAKMPAPKKPLFLQVRLGGEAGRISDPFAYQVKAVVTGAPAGAFNACKWMFCVETEQARAWNGEWKRSTARLRTHIRGSSPSFGILFDGQRASWRRTSFTDPLMKVGTARETTTALVGIEIGRGPFAHASPRLTLLYGYAEDRRDSWITSDSFTATEALTRSPAWVAGARADTSVTVRRWLRIGGEFTYLHPTDRRMVRQLEDEWSARCIVAAPATKRISVFGDIRYTPDTPTLMPESSIGFGIRWTK